VAREASPTPADFAALAPHYDRLRPQDELWHELFRLLVARGDLGGRRVLEVGCGTGALSAELAALGSKVWGVDSSPEMLGEARARAAHGAGFKLGRAEALPFKDGWFERAVMRLVVHHLDRPAAFAEVHRVLAPEGRLVIASFGHAHFDSWWLNGAFPEVAGIDRARFPSAAALQADLEAAGFAKVVLERLSQRRRVAREDALAKIRGRFISTLAELSEDEIARGLAVAEATLPEVIDTRLEWIVVVGACP
jgi:SAM-dependent methyltransferase